MDNKNISEYEKIIKSNKEIAEDKMVDFIFDDLLYYEKKKDKLKILKDLTIRKKYRGENIEQLINLRKMIEHDYELKRNYEHLDNILLIEKLFNIK